MSDVRITTAMTEALAAIARFYPATADPPRTVASQIRLAYGSRTPIAASVISLRRETVDTLTSWALLVAEERDLRPGIAAGDVGALTSLLSTHAAWLSGHEAADDAVYELERLATELEDIAKQRRPARVRIAPCPEMDAEGAPCTGRLVATVRRDDTLLPPTIRCDLNRDHAWEAQDWRGLGRRVGPARHAAAMRLVNAIQNAQPRSSGVRRPLFTLVKAKRSA